MCRHAWSPFGFKPLYLLFTLLLVLAPAISSHAGEKNKRAAPTSKTPKELTTLLGRGFQCLERDDVVVISDLDMKTLLPLVSQDFELYSYILSRDYFDRGRLGGGRQPPSTKLVVFLFKDHDSYVEGMSRLEPIYISGDTKEKGGLRNGYYLAKGGSASIFINYRDNYEQGLATYAHEMTHALIRKEFLRAPAWLNEGFATMIGRSQIVNSHLRYNPSNGLQRVRSSLEQGRALSLQQLLQSTPEDFAGRTSRPYYDQADLFCRFLHSRNELLPIYRELRDGKLGDEPILRITGQYSLNDLDKIWHDWLRNQQ